MNDTELHSRLTALADELAPDADPYAQIADARGLHRRRQRARLGVAGAAVAVALVAVGVPAAVGTLSAPGDGDTAGPSTSSEPLRGPAGAVRSAMSSWDGSVPDPEAGLPCPDLTEDLSGLDSRHGFEASGSNTGGTLTGCSWATDVSGPPPGVLLTLRAAFDRGADELAEALDEDDGCPSATVFPGRTANVLQVCETDRGQLWRLTVVDEDGTGSWVITAAVDDGVPGRFPLAAMSLATMWTAVAGPDDEPDAPRPGGEPETTPVNREVDELVEALDRREVPVLGSGDGWGCPGATAELEERLGVDLTEGPVRTSLPPEPVCWWTAGPEPADGGGAEDGVEAATSPALTIAYQAGAETLLPEEAFEPGVRSAGGPLASGTDATCLTSEVVGGLTIDACSTGDRTRFSVLVPDAEGRGVWTLSVGLPPEAGIDPSDALLGLVDVADRLW